MTERSLTAVSDLVEAVERIVDEFDDERDITERVAVILREALDQGLDLPEAVQRPNPDRYVMYPLWVDEANRFSIASAVWGKGQVTPIHDHGTWGVVGIHSGLEREESFTNPTLDPAGVPTALGAEVWKSGEVTVCCTTDADVHRVSSDGDAPCVGIHIYGSDIGTLQRRAFNPETGAVSYFVSAWGTPATTP